MTAPACATCRFWRVGEYRDAGRCHRYAPHPAHQWVAWHGEQIVALTDLLMRHLNLEWPHGIEPEPTETTAAAEFPCTSATDWCGEHEEAP